MRSDPMKDPLKGPVLPEEPIPGAGDHSGEKPVVPGKDPEMPAR